MPHRWARRATLSSFSPASSIPRVLAFETRKGRAAAANLGTTLCALNYLQVSKGESYEEAYLALLSGSAFAQNTGPAPQTGMEKPGTTNGAKPDSSMDTTGMSATKGNIKRSKDGAPAPKDEKK
jgi:hypothetical protein